MPEQIQVPEPVKSALGNLTHSFTGSDIKAVIIRKDDPILLKRAMKYLEDIQNATQNAQAEPSMASPTEGIRDFDDEVPYADGLLYPVVNLQTITVSTYRNKTQVRALGHVNPRGHARGSRTIAGTMIFTEFDRDPFWSLIAYSKDPVPAQDYNIGDAGDAVLPDQLAPFGMLLLFANEGGGLAYRMLYGLELITNGIVYSIQDMYNENTISFLATDVTPLTPLPAVVSRDDLLSPEAHAEGTGESVRISPLTSVTTGKEVLRRYRLLKNSRLNTR